MQHGPVGIGHAGGADHVGRAIGVAVQHLGRGAGIHLAIVLLVLLLELSEAVVNIKNFVDRRGARRVAVAGDLLH